MPDADPARWSEEQAARWEALADELRRRLGPGTPLPPAERSRLQAQLGADLSGAAVHPTPLAGRLARGLGGEAVTLGSHILGASGDLDPHTPRGAGLLGHELIHAVRSPAPIQRVTPEPSTSEQHNEALAQSVETGLLQQAAAPPVAAPSADPDAVAERVYRRLVDELLLERERSFGVR
jgi:uncharacterized protein DUF4157